MTPTAWPVTREIVLVGGGHSHTLVARMWGMQPLAGARLTLVSPNPTAAYSGMLPGAIARPSQQDEIEIDLVRLARFANARLILPPAIGIGLSHPTGQRHGRTGRTR